LSGFGQAKEHALKQTQLALDVERTTPSNSVSIAVSDEQRQALIRLMAQAIAVVRARLSAPRQVDEQEVDDVEQE
jgi:hypothetical protein